MVVMFAVASGLAFSAAVIRGDAMPSVMMAGLVLTIGVINSFGTFCQWQAYKHSLSKSSLFLPVGQVIAAALAAIFLSEAFLYTNRLFVLAVILLFAAGMFLSRRDSTETVDNRNWLGWIAGMISVFGVAIFAQKLFSATIPTTQFLGLWYMGGIVGSIVLVRLERDPTPFVIKRDAWRSVIAGVAIMATLATLYWTFQIAPAGIVLPIKSFVGTLLIVGSGWLFFGERHVLTKSAKTGFVFGLLGVFLLALARSY